MDTSSMRFGLVGTGPWAAMAHGPGLQASSSAELVGVWGRRPEAARELGSRLGVAAYDDLDAMLAEVDAVAFSVPPDVQAELALRAARAGKHLLLDKPVSVDATAGRRLADAADEHGVASVVFLTDRFAPEVRAWLGDVAARGPWQGAWARWLAALYVEGNPFGASPWRRERGALYDVGPHVLSLLTATLGPVVDVHAHRGAGDLVHLVLKHEGGATSTATVSFEAAPAAEHTELGVWGEGGVTTLPPRVEGGAVPALGLAADELVAAARSGRPHELDVRFGVRLVELVEQAAAQLG